MNSYGHIKDDPWAESRQQYGLYASALGRAYRLATKGATGREMIGTLAALEDRIDHLTVVHTVIIGALQDEIRRLGSTQTIRACTNCEKDFAPKDPSARWCPSCARAGRAAVAMSER